MEGSFTQEKNKMACIDCHRVLRSYRQMNDVLLSSRTWGRFFGDEDKFNETEIRAQMFAIRSVILEVEDSRERLFLYHYYIKGNTLENCAKILGISRRSVFRLKSMAINNIAEKINSISVHNIT